MEYIINGRCAGSRPVSRFDSGCSALIQIRSRGGDVSDVKDQIKLDYLSGVPPKKLTEKYGTSMNTIKSWIKRYGWSKMKKQGAPSGRQGAFLMR